MHPSLSFPRRPLLLACLSASFLLPGLLSAQTNGTWAGGVTGTSNWSDTAAWTTTPTAGSYPQGTDASAVLSANFTGNLALNMGTVTLGSISFSDITSPTHGVQLQAGTGNTANLTFDTSTGSPSVSVTTGATSNVPLQFTGGGGTLNILGSKGLTLNINGSTTAGRFAAGVNWTSFSGGLNLSSGNYQTEAANVLPQHTPLNIGAGVQFRAVFNNARDQALRGITGGTATTMVGGNDNNTTSMGTLTLGVNSTASDAYNFAGILGGDAFTASQRNDYFRLTKTGASTQILSGDNLYVGDTTVSGGTLLVNGTHAPTLAGTLTSAGKYLVTTGATLGGNGTIRPVNTGGGTVMVDIQSGGILSPGTSIGTLTFDNTNSAASVLNFSTGGSALFELGSGLSSDRISITGNASLAQEVFFNNTVLDFSDLTGGSLSPGSYLLFAGDANTGYGNLTLDGLGNITGGLSIGSGLGSYPGSSLLQTGNNIVLNVVPEPSALSLAAFALLALRPRRR